MILGQHKPPNTLPSSASCDRSVSWCTCHTMLTGLSDVSSLLHSWPFEGWANEIIGIPTTKTNSLHQRESKRKCPYFSMTKVWWGQRYSWALGRASSRGLGAVAILTIFYFGFLICLVILLLLLCRMASYIQKIQLLTALNFSIVKLCHQRMTKGFDLTFLLPKSLVPRQCPHVGHLCPFPAHLSAAPFEIRCVGGMWGEERCQ